MSEAASGSSATNARPTAFCPRRVRAQRAVASHVTTRPELGSGMRTCTRSPSFTLAPVTTKRPPSEMSSLLPSHGPASDLSWACGNCGLFFETEAEAIDCEVGHGDDTVSVDGDEEVAPM